jgi:two-component system cell cycle response regulator DivK
MQGIFTILYVEDNADNRLLVQRILHARGYRVAEASSAIEALNYIQGHQPDLILMDINMPEIDGYTLTRQIRRKSGFENIPIIALTANVMERDHELSISAGCDGYIEKPIDIETFTEVVSGFLNHR